nr:MAG TPA: hypothetical protein [Caudoviricetes sp.]
MFLANLLKSQIRIFNFIYNLLKFDRIINCKRSMITTSARVYIVTKRN